MKMKTRSRSSAGGLTEKCRSWSLLEEDLGTKGLEAGNQKEKNLLYILYIYIYIYTPPIGVYLDLH